MRNILSYEESFDLLNEGENFYQKYIKKGDFDHFNEIVVPKMKEAGFKRVEEPAQKGMSTYGSGYFCYPDHNTGVNLFLYAPFSGAWKYVVYHEKSQASKEFSWKTGTEQEVKKAATDAVNYAIELKKKNYPE